MPATFEDCVFTDSSGTVISVAHGTDLKVAGTTSHGHRGNSPMFLERDPPSMIGWLGLRHDTPPIQVHLFLNSLKAAGEFEASAVAAKAKDCGLIEWLDVGANIATLAAAVHDAVQAGYLDRMIALCASAVR